MENTKILKTLVLLSLSVFTILLLVSPQFTGWFIDTLKINIGINSSAQGCLFFVDVMDSVYPNDDVNFSIYLENCGNQPLSGRINLAIWNTSQILNQINSSDYSLNPFETFEFNYTWNATYTRGDYYAVAKDNYTNETVSVNMTFSIIPVPVPPPPEVPGPTPTPGAPAARVNFTVDVLDNVTMNLDSTQIFLVKITNTGDRVLTNLTLEITHGNITITTAPNDITSLAVNDSLILSVKLDSTGMVSGEHLLGWKVSASGVSRSGFVKIIIKESTMEQECRESILYYLEVMDTLKEEIYLAQSEGKNVSTINDLFEEATYELVAAQTYYKIESHQECVDRIAIVKINIERIVIELSKARPEPITLTLPIVYQMVMWSILSMVLILVLLYLLKKIVEYNRRRGRRLRLIFPRKWT